MPDSKDYAQGAWPRMAPNLTVFTSSAAIMLVQLVASRLIAQYVGQSLYTWTGIIGITLAGIALGNYLGGRIADISFRRRTLGLLFLAACIAELSILALNPLVGAISFGPSVPWPMRVVTHIVLVYLVPFTALGAISPLIARRALHLGTRAGRTIGDIYAWSIGGSITGTFLTGYYLMGHFGNQSLVIASAAVLGTVGLLYVLRDRGGEPTPEDTASAGEEDSAWKGASLWFPILTVFLASAGLMAIELVASRLLSRTFGQSLYTWTTIIGVILAGLTLGGAIGGRLADRLDNRKLLSRLFVLSALTSLAIPPVNVYLRNYPLLWGLPWTTHIFFNCVLTYFLPALLLGMIPPVVVHLALEKGFARGRTVGTIYAWGSVGSIVGTFATGLWFIDWFGTINVLIGVVALCAVLAMSYSPGGALQRFTLGLSVFIVAAVSIPWAPLTRIAQFTALKPFEGSESIYVDESSYSYIKIYTNNPDFPNIRSFALDKLVHSIADIEHPGKLHYPYEWYYESVLERDFPEGEPLNALVIGGGGYAFPHYLEVTRPGSYIETIEIDPAVTEAAHAAFGLPRDTEIAIYNMDARNRVADLIAQEETTGDAPKFDYIFGDSINDYSVPFHLTTLEFTQDIHTLLNNQGVYMLNLIDLYSSGLFLGAMINTCKAVFPHVYVFSTAGETDRRDTFVVVSAKRPLDLEGIAEEVNAAHLTTGEQLGEAELAELAGRVGDVVLTDNFAPVDNLLAPVVAFSQEVFTTRRLGRADRFLKANKPGKALEEVRTALEGDSQNPESWDMLGTIYWEQGNSAEAEAAFERSIEISGNRWPPYHNLASTKFEQQDWQGAIDLWQKVVQLAPAHADARVYMGLAYYNLGDAAEALAQLERAADLDPNRESVWINMGAILFGQGEVAQAAEALEKACALNPENGTVQEQRATAYWRLQRYEEAWQAVAAAQAAGHTVNPEFLKTLQRDSGRTQQAL